MADEAVVRGAWRAITEALIARRLSISTMESCTGGQIASLITDTEGASAVMKGAFVTYSNEAKLRQGVPRETIETHGVYSSETAAAMAMACAGQYGADIGIGVTGTMANVDPANADSVPGAVYIALLYRGELHSLQLSLGPQPSRCAAKLAIAGAIADGLQALLDRDASGGS